MSLNFILIRNKRNFMLHCSLLLHNARVKHKLIVIVQIPSQSVIVYSKQLRFSKAFEDRLVQIIRKVQFPQEHMSKDASVVSMSRVRPLSNLKRPNERVMRGCLNIRQRADY